ncbi:MAG: ATPase [Acidimicrobiales bacterium]|nr:MAG: ATPase [Acidimicrobiales bacterium]
MPFPVSSTRRLAVMAVGSNGSRVATVDPAVFFRSSKVLIVAGKGGVGKTTVSAAMARAAALSGLSTLIVEVEGKSGLAALFGREPLGYEEVVLDPGGGPLGAADIRGRTITPDEALLEYLRDHGMSRVSKRLLSSGALDVVSTAAPGIRDILILGKVKQLERRGEADLIVIDAPAAGHAVTFLQSASGLADAVRVGPVRAQAEEVLELLTDASRCQVVLVTLPEETPVNEVVDTAYSLEDRVGIHLGPVVVNGVYPPLDGLEEDPEKAAAECGAFLRPGEAGVLAAAASFRLRRSRLQAEQIARLTEQLPLPQLVLPFRFSPDLDRGDVEGLARALLEQIAQMPELAGDTTGAES